MTSVAIYREMNHQQFWKIIDRSRNTATGDKSMQAHNIYLQLLEYTPSQISRFEQLLKQYLHQADDHKVMGAEMIIDGMVSQDIYLYFRCWLVSLGQKNYIKILEKPDLLADKVSEDADIQFAELLTIPAKVYAEKTGKSNKPGFEARISLYKSIEYQMDNYTTTGNDWTIDQLPLLYPRLWSKFH